MATRKIKDAKDLETNELIFFKGHAKATYMSDGSTVEDAINNIGTGGGGATGPQGPQGEQGPKGDDGVGIASVVQTTTSSADGGSNVVTVTLSDGKTSTFTVKNGSKGSQGEKGDKGDTGAEGPQGVQGIQGIQGPKGDTGADGAQGPKGDQGEQGPKGDKGDKGDTGATGANGTNGKDGADGATFTPSVDANGNLSWTNNMGLTNPPTVNIKGPKGDSGEGGGSSSGGGMNVVVMDDYVVDYAEPNTIYVITTNGIGGGLEVYEFIPPTNGYAEYVFIFQVGVMHSGFSIPEYVMWPNGQFPDVVSSDDVSYAAVYELNISASLVDGGEYIYKAVLTHFKEAQL